MAAMLSTIQEPGVQEMFSLLPTPGGNNSGKPARTALVSKLKGSTPGRHTEAHGKGDTFRKIFFPNYKSAPYEGNTSLSSLDNKWWSDFSTVVLCQAMYNLTSDLRKQLKKDNINNAVNSKNSELKKHCMSFYAKVFSQTFAKKAYDSIQNKKSAKAEYIAVLTSDAWITAKRTVASEGMWTDAAWELYHHWVKLHLLGASNKEIDGIIKQLKSKELMIPQEVGAGNWTSYTAWMDPSAITWKDIQGDAAKGILKSVMMPSYGPYGRPSSMKEENSFEFTANGQPGSGYRHSPGHHGGGSCFTGDTKVLMANGTRLPIRSVEPESEEDLLYDLILEPTEDGFPHYVVGDNNILIIVASEVPRIELAPFAAITILEALQEAADEIERQPLPVNRGEPPCRVPHVFHIFSPTKAMVSNAASMAVHMKTKQTESCDVSDMLSVFVKEDPASEQTSYRRELGDAYEQIAALHGEEIDALVDLGFRSIGGEDDNDQLLLSVSLLDIIFHDVPKHSPGQSLAVNIEASSKLKTDQAWCEESKEKMSSNFARHFRQVFYFQNLDLDDECCIDLCFQVHNVEKSHPLPYTASAVVPCNLEHNYRMFEAILHEEGDQEVGLMRFDVRFLSRNAMQEEQTRSDTWKDADKQAYALALGKCYGEYLKEQLSSVRSHGLVPVAKRPWFKLFCFNM
uniref:Uncharacterized protein n=1 Tax=Branchiostoma floridae TaxID=7739 RepID=C3Z9D1_BRAFL|eukprot:XP_002594849.1 hypothetical protein BRAFLDRAFT_124437 [Branchiostoma floridae]